MAASRLKPKRKAASSKTVAGKSVAKKAAAKKSVASKSDKARRPAAAKAPTKTAKSKHSGRAKAARVTKTAANRASIGAHEPVHSVSQQPLQLPERLDSSTAASVLAELKAQRGKAIVVDGSHVRRVGAQPLQILVSAARTWQSDGCDYCLLNPSNELLEAASILGLPASELAISG